MWRHVAQSLLGPSHAAENAVCQDSHLVQVLGDDQCDGQTIVACAADGAGSAKHSDLGSALACQTIIDNASRYFDAHGNFNKLQREDIVAWLEKIREKLLLAAQEQGYSMRELASTLCVAIVTPGGSFFFQIGDGAITIGHHGVYGVVFWPQSGEYANTTNFVTSDNFKDHLVFQTTTTPISDFAIFTDGIERLALNFDTQTPHLPFFQPLFQAIRSSSPGGNLAADLGKFLQSESITSRSDDDKTLILASQLVEGDR